MKLVPEQYRSLDPRLCPALPLDHVGLQSFIEKCTETQYQGRMFYSGKDDLTTANRLRMIPSVARN